MKDCEANRSLKPFSITAFSSTLQRYFNVTVEKVEKFQRYTAEKRCA